MGLLFVSISLVERKVVQYLVLYTYGSQAYLRYFWLHIQELAETGKKVNVIIKARFILIFVLPSDVTTLGIISCQLMTSARITFLCVKNYNFKYAKNVSF